MGRPAILITGAAGEVGHSLIDFFSKEDEFQIIAFDINKVATRPGTAKDFTTLQGDITDKKKIEELFVTYDIRKVFHLAGILSTGGERNPERTHQVNVNGSFNLLQASHDYSQKIGTSVQFIFPSTIAVYGIPSLGEKSAAGKVKEGQFLAPITMYGNNKLYVENTGRYFSSFYKQLDSTPSDIRIDFRAVRFPGLMSSETLPTGGTSDYASEMIHACAQNKPYASFASAHIKIPFMAMPDGIEALVQISKAPRAKLTQTSYNVGAFSVSAEDIRKQLLQTYPNAQITYVPNMKRENILNTWPEDVDDAKARADWGWKPNYSFAASFQEYLIPGIQKKYN